MSKSQKIWAFLAEREANNYSNNGTSEVDNDSDNGNNNNGINKSKIRMMILCEIFLFDNVNVSLFDDI